MKKFLFIGFFILTSLLFSISAYADDAGVNLDKTSMQNGILKISCNDDTGKAIKVIIEKDGNKYIYNLRSDGIQESYSLQMGNGTYKVSVFRNLQGNSYMPIFSDTIELNLTDSNKIYLNSIQNINWDLKMKAIQKAASLVKSAKNDSQKINIIYNYVVSNFSYDFDKFKNLDKLPNPYIPVIDKTYVDRKGICYDYSALFASMLRSQNIPTKLQMGYTKNVKEYHAWNEVYVASQKKWIIVDTTYDSQLKKAKRSFSMSKSQSLYAYSKTY